MISIEKRNVLVQEEGIGKNVAIYLGERYTYRSVYDWTQEILSLRVLLNDKPTSPHTTLAKGDKITTIFLPRTEPEVRTDWIVLLEDDRFIFVNKCPNLPCHPGGAYLEHSLLTQLKRAFPDYPALSLAHRLDRDTTGVILATKTGDAASLAGSAFASNGVNKEYQVLVEGRFPTSIDANGFLFRDPRSPVRKKRAFSMENPKGVEPIETARTELCLITTNNQDDESPLSLVRAIPHTGRTHQIRATLRSLGFPVIGDTLYGPDDSLFLSFIEGRLSETDKSRLRLPYHALHCSRLHLNLEDGSRYNVSSPLPDFWNPLLVKLDN
jgi:23S rRNA-/tRNA-specific pseudouridylate synthase